MFKGDVVKQFDGMTDWFGQGGATGYGSRLRPQQPAGIRPNAVLLSHLPALRLLQIIQVKARHAACRIAQQENRWTASTNCDGGD